ncbi:flagellar hook-associated protein FlgK [Hydrogenimonas sp.]
MASIFNALNIGYSGLKSSQVAIDTTGHNIANAQNPHYTRQRVEITPNDPLSTVPGDIGLGAKISQIVRIHDEFVYKRLQGTTTDNEYHQFRQETLDELSTHFPEIDENGIYKGMEEYFNAWNDFSKNTDDSSLKINLAQNTRTFTAALRNTHDRIAAMQDSLDNQLKTTLDEINRLGKEIAAINVRINTDEAGGNNANDLRDQRDKLELTLAKLVDIAVSKGDLQPDNTIDRHLIESGEHYHLSIGGASFVDGSTWHPLVFDHEKGSKLGTVYYERQDHVRFDITDYIHGGKVGAILSLRDGDIQGVLDDLDSFASSLAIYTNDIYATHATTSMKGDTYFDATQTIGDSTLPIGINDNESGSADVKGSFYVKVYDIDGNEVTRRKITLTGDSTFQDVAAAINASDQDDLDALGDRVLINAEEVTDHNDTESLDDTGDHVEGTDLDDYVQASIETTERGDLFSLSLKQGNYTFAIEEVNAEHPTLFAGALGLGRFFDNRTAGDIRLNRTLDENPTKIGGNGAPIAGDNTVANRMIELQYEKIDFFLPADSKNLRSNDTLSGFFRMSATDVAAKTASAHSSAETSETLLTTVVKEFDSISKVDIDEELTNLMKYQTGYSASAKVITTIDQMIQTLLNIKQ